MGQFSYSARTKAGVIEKGTIFAGDRAAASAALVEKNLTPILVKEMAASRQSGGFLSKFVGKVSLQDKVIFSRQFATMINAGVPIAQSLNILRQQSASKRLQTVVAEVAKQVEGGGTLAAALAEHPDVFSPIYINMVKAGEQGGILDQVLDRLATQQEKDAEIISKVKSAMIYPGVVTTATIAAFFFLMTVIVPKLGSIFAQVGGTLPVYTVVMLKISNFMTHEWYVLIGGAVAAVAIFIRWRKTPKGRHAVDAFLLKSPIFGPILVKMSVARFARTFGSLLASGISVLEAINSTRLAMNNVVYQEELAAVAQKVKNGRTMSEQLRDSKNFPAIVGQMLAVGEETGQMDVILLKLAEFYEKEVDTTVAGLTSIIEPILILVLGTMVGFVVISVFGPLSNIDSQVGNG